MRIDDHRWLYYQPQRVISGENLMYVKTISGFSHPEFLKLN